MSPGRTAFGLLPSLGVLACGVVAAFIVSGSALAASIILAVFLVIAVALFFLRPPQEYLSRCVVRVRVDTIELEFGGAVPTDDVAEVFVEREYGALSVRVKIDEEDHTVLMGLEADEAEIVRDAIERELARSAE